jgi:hypothetical protein
MLHGLMPNARYEVRNLDELTSAVMIGSQLMYEGVNLDGIQFFNTDINKGSVLLFKPSQKSPDSKVVQIKRA